MNLFMFIIWNKAYHKKDEIIHDISKSFIVHKTIEVRWSESLFAENLSRFYGQKLPKGCHKEQACGVGPFTLVIFEDPSPVYELRKTTRGVDELVNINTFDKKTEYRKLSSDESERFKNHIHGTNSVEETEHDLTLLTGYSPEEFMEKVKEIPDTLTQDIVGAKGWDSLNQLFYVLNHTCKYVVLRNFEGLPESFHIGGHEDIDILTDKYEDIRLICNAKAVFRQKYRVQCMCNISGCPTQFDFRYVGDGYYDEKWEKNILKNRTAFNDIYVPDDENYPYMILYHALIHKRKIAEDYIQRLDAMFGSSEWGKECLEKFMGDNGYCYTEPNDLSVYFNTDIAKINISPKRKAKTKVKSVKRSIKKMISRG